MVGFVRRWLAPPVFPGDGEKTRQAALLNAAIVTLLVLMPVLIVGNVLGGRTPTSVPVLDFLMFAACVVLRGQMRKGRVAQASGWLLALGIAATTGVLARLGTVRAPAAAMYLQLIITAGLLTGLFGMIATITVCTIAVVGLILAGNAGLLPTPDLSVGITQGITYAAAFVWTGGLMYGAIRLLRRAIADAETELSGRIRAEADLARHLSQLEETVQARTAELTLVNARLRDSLAKVKTLAGIIPLCMHCKKIRDDTGYWSRLEQFLNEHTEAEFSHGICPECLEKHYPQDA